MLLMHGANMKEKNEQHCVLRLCTVYSYSYSNIFGIGGRSKLSLQGKFTQNL
jgi:hypothetical protein